MQVVQPCVAQWNTNGTITMQSFSTKAGCTSYNFLSEPLLCAGGGTGVFRPDPDHECSQCRRVLEQDARASPSDTSVQFRAEVFNLANTFNFYQQQPNSSLTSSSFGTVVKANVSSNNGNQPRVHSVVGEVQLLVTRLTFEANDIFGKQCRKPKPLRLLKP